VDFLGVGVLGLEEETGVWVGGGAMTYLPLFYRKTLENKLKGKLKSN